jgi:hypothetical protein
MAGIVYGDPGNHDYRGLAEIFEFVNDDGELFYRNCGQAAAATLLTHEGVLEPTQETAGQIMRSIENAHPPDNFFGWFGTSRRCVTHICKEHGLELEEVDGEEELCRQLDRGNPVVVMLGVSAGKFLGVDLPGGHWMVAYGYDNQSVYLTNNGVMPWDEFRSGWKSLVSRSIQMRRRGLAFRHISTAPAVP